MQRQARSTLQCRPEVAALKTQDEVNEVQSSQVCIGGAGEKKHVDDCRLLIKPIANGSSRRKCRWE
jgi:hypothetical protein